MKANEQSNHTNATMQTVSKHIPIPPLSAKDTIPAIKKNKCSFLESTMGEPKMPPWTVAKALLVCLLCTAILQPLLLWIAPTNIAMLFILMVIITSWLWGRFAGILSACISVAAFDFFFIEPRLSFTVNDVQYLITFAVMLIVALSISYLLSLVRSKQSQAEQHATQTETLYRLATQMIKVLRPQDIAGECTQFIQQALGYQTILLLPVDSIEVENLVYTATQPTASASDNSLICTTKHQPSIIEHMAAQSLYTSPSTTHNMTSHDDGYYSHYMLLQGTTRKRGVLLVRAEEKNSASFFQNIPLLDAMSSIVATTIERLHYIDLANQHQHQVKTEQLRNSILSALSHDIRTPLTAMYGLADSLLHWATSTTNPVVQETAERLCTQAMALNQMVSNLLELSKIKSGQLILKREWIPLEELIGSSLHTLSAALQGISLSTDISTTHISNGASVDVLIYADPVLFERVLANIIDNAIKYNAPQHRQKWIDIRARVEAHQCQITIFNPAHTLSQTELLQIFTQFERLGSEKKQTGTGIGLSIAKAILDAHAATISAHMQTQINPNSGLAEQGVAIVITCAQETPPTFDTTVLEAQHAMHCVVNH